MQYRGYDMRVRYILQIVFLALLLNGFVLQTIGHGDIPVEEDVHKPLSVGLFVILLIFIISIISIFIYWLYRNDNYRELVPIKAISILAAVLIIVNSVVVGYLYVEF